MYNIVCFCFGAFPIHRLIIYVRIPANLYIRRVARNVAAVTRDFHACLSVPLSYPPLRHSCSESRDPIHSSGCRGDRNCDALFVNERLQCFSSCLSALLRIHHLIIYVRILVTLYICRVARTIAAVTRDFHSCLSAPLWYPPLHNSCSESRDSIHSSGCTSDRSCDALFVKERLQRFSSCLSASLQIHHLINYS